MKPKKEGVKMTRRRARRDKLSLNEPVWQIET